MSNPLTGIPLIGGLFDDSSDQAMGQLKNNQSLYQGVNLPNLQTYRPQDYQYQGDYDPLMMQAQTIQEDPSIRQAQLGALTQMAGLAQNGLSDVDQAGYEQARQLGGQVARGANDAALQNAAARNLAGSGMEFAMREQGAQDAATRAQQAGLQQAADSARQRALYNQAYAGALGNLRSQDFGVNRANTDIINQFNQMNTQNQNQAQLRNLNARQDIGNANVGQSNQAQLTNNSIRQQGYQNQLQKTGAQAGANSGVAQGYYNQGAENQANRNSNAQIGLGIAGMAGAFGGGAGAAKGAAPLSQSSLDDLNNGKYSNLALNGF